ncbi:C40 family peptidase [Methylorubrum aminovorans]
MSDAAVMQSVSGQGIASKAIEVMGQVSGKPYTPGGKTKAGFDCSGYVSYVFAALFTNNNAAMSMNVAGFISSDLFQDVTGEPQAGDIIIFPSHGGSPNHIGIVLSADGWIGSQSSTGVAKVKFSNPYWNARPQHFRRCKQVSTATVALGRIHQFQVV